MDKDRLFFIKAFFLGHNISRRIVQFSSQVSASVALIQYDDIYWSEFNDFFDWLQISFSFCVEVYNFVFDYFHSEDEIVQKLPLIVWGSGTGGRLALQAALELGADIVYFKRFFYYTCFRFFLLITSYHSKVWK